MEFGVTVLPWKKFPSGIWDLPFYMAGGDKMLGTYGIAHRTGGRFVVCGSVIQVCGYWGFHILWGFVFVWGHCLVCLVAGGVELLLLEQSLMSMIRPGL